MADGGEGGRKRGQRRLPFARPGLTEQAGGGVPRAIRPLPQPAEIAGELQQDPYRAPHGAGEMGDRGIDAHHQIHAGEQGGGVAEIREIGAVDMHGAECRFIRWPYVALQDMDLGVGQRGEEMGGRDGAQRVIGVLGAAGEGDADAPFRRGPKAVAPRGDAGGLGGEIGRTRGDRRQPGAEGARQAEQRAAQIMRRHRLIARDLPLRHHLVGEMRDEAGERLLHLQHHMSSALTHQWRVADELDAIAQPLLAMQQHPLAR